MTRTPRPIVVVSVAGRVARLTVIDNGAPFTYLDVADAADLAGVKAHTRRGAVLVGLSQLADVEAVLQWKHPRAIVQRRTS